MPEIDYSQYSKETLERLLLETKNNDEAKRIANELQKRGTEDLLKSINSQSFSPKAHSQKVAAPNRSTRSTYAATPPPTTRTSAKTNVSVSPQPSSHPNQVVESRLDIPIIRRILLFCSGAKISILTRKDCAIEQNKYEMIGTTVLFTALLASLSGGYALSIVFKPLALSASLGIGWGAIIFNLDRFIVSTIRKKGNFFTQILVATPRIILAGFLAVVITKPLELTLFQKEIEAGIAKQNSEALIAERNRLAEKVSQNPELVNLRNRREQVKQRLQELESQRSLWFDESVKEADGIKDSRSTGVVGKGPAYDDKKSEVERLTGLVNEEKENLNKLDEQISKLTEQTDSAIETIQTIQKDASRLLTQLETMEKLSANDPIIRVINLFITLIFVMLETSPVVVKLLSKSGPYDAILENEEESVSHLYTSKTLEMKFAIDQERNGYNEIFKEEFNDYRNLRASMREFDLNQELDSYKKMRERLQGVINDQFLEAVDKVLNDPEFSSVQYKVIDTILRQLENELIKYSEGVQFADNEMLEFMEKVKAQVRASALNNGFQQSVNTQAHRN